MSQYFFFLLVLFCISFAININDLNIHGQTALISGIMYHDELKIFNILLSYGTDVNIIDIYGKSALSYAVELNRINAFKLLLAYSVDINILYSSKINISADILNSMEYIDKSIFEVVKECNIDEIEEYLEFTKISPNIRDENGCALWLYAMSYCDIDVFSMLLDNELSLKYTTSNNCSSIVDKTHSPKYIYNWSELLNNIH